MKKTSLIAIVCLACALCLAMVGCGGVNKEAYTGAWDLESGSDENLGVESIAMMKSYGLEVTMTLNEDGTGLLNLFGEPLSLKWEAKSNSEGTVTFDEGKSAALKLANGKLTLEDSTGSSMTFIKLDSAAVSSAAASSAAASSEAASSEAASGSEASSAASSEAASSAAASSEAASSEATSAQAASSEAASTEAASSEAASSEASAAASSAAAAESNASEAASSSAAAA